MKRVGHCATASSVARRKHASGITTPWPLFRGDELWVGWSQSDMVLRSAKLGK